LALTSDVRRSAAVKAGEGGLRMWALHKEVFKKIVKEFIERNLLAYKGLIEKVNYFSIFHI